MISRHKHPLAHMRIRWNPHHHYDDRSATHSPSLQEPFSRLEGVVEAVGGGYCWFQMPLAPALAVRGTVAGRRLGARRGGLGGWRSSPPSNASLPGDEVRTSCTQTCTGPPMTAGVGMDTDVSTAALTRPATGAGTDARARSCPRDTLNPSPVIRGYDGLECGTVVTASWRANSVAVRFSASALKASWKLQGTRRCGVVWCGKPSASLRQPGLQLRGGGQ